MSEWSLYEGDPEPTPRELKPKKHDKHGREMTQEPALDIPMRRFRENIDPDKLELFLNQHEKYQTFIASLHDPAYSKLTFAIICRKFGVSLHELQTLYTDGMRHLGLLEMAANLPQVMVDVSEDAKSRMVSCPRCDGEGVVWFGMEDKQQSKPCPQCKGVKEVRVSGDKHARDLMFESMKLTGQRGPLVAIQQNFGDASGLDAKMEGMLKLTQGITMGEKKDPAPAVEVKST